MEPDKYIDAIKKHQLNLTEQEISKEVEKIISEEFDINNNKEIYKNLYSCIDLTSLNSTDSKESIWNFTQKVNDFEGSIPELNNVAAICVFPNLVHTVKETLTADVKIAAVAGGFPSSQTFIEVKVAECSLALADGADEIDIVINLGQFLDKEYQEMCEEIMEIKEVCKNKSLKVILETGALVSSQNIHEASILSMYSGADFIKTSTGKGYPGATPEAFFVMCMAIKSYFKKTNKKVGIKVSGGVSTINDAVIYYSIANHVLGTEWCNNKLFRIGTSRLAGIVLDELIEK
jgi:deoxyribose-phosphate aldolase